MNSINKHALENVKHKHVRLAYLNTNKFLTTSLHLEGTPHAVVESFMCTWGFRAQEVWSGSVAGDEYIVSLLVVFPAPELQHKALQGVPTTCQ